MSSPRIVVIPTYNEKENIQKMVYKVMQLSPEFHLLVVDDSSPDGTGALVKVLQPQYEGRLFLLERKEKKRSRNSLHRRI